MISGFCHFRRGFRRLPTTGRVVLLLGFGFAMFLCLFNLNQATFRLETTTTTLQTVETVDDGPSVLKQNMPPVEPSSVVSNHTNDNQDANVKKTPTTDNTAAKIQRLGENIISPKEQQQPDPNRGRLFTCGYKVGRLRELLFPDFDHVGTYFPYSNETLSTDILYFGMHGPCPASYQELSTHFRGMVLLLNGEPFGVMKHHLYSSNNDTTTKLNKTKFVQIGMQPSFKKKTSNNFPGLSSSTNGNENDPEEEEHHPMIVYYAAMSLLGYIPQEQWSWIFNASMRPINNHHEHNTTRKVVYLSKNCRPHRQAASKAIHKILPVDALGKCQVVRRKDKTTAEIPKSKEAVPTNRQRRRLLSTSNNGSATMSTDNSTTATNDLRQVVRSHHFQNWQIYSQYKYCLVLENSNPPSYLSEKILWAYLGGCVPIYWGSKQDVYKVFHKESFVFWNVKNHTKGLQQLQYLEANPQAYEEMLHNRPILKDGENTLKHYFSLSDDIGGGYLKQRIRRALRIE